MSAEVANRPVAAFGGRWHFSPQRRENRGRRRLRPGAHDVRVDEARADPDKDIDLSTGVATPNGRTVVLGRFAWTAAGNANVFGKDGPVLGEMRRHATTRCETVNSNFHQRFTLGDVAGTVDGVPVTAYNLYPQVSELDPNAPGAIFDNWFRVVDHSRGCV